MRIFVTGATGFIGRALVLRLRRDAHDVVAWVRSAERAGELLGDEVELVATAGGPDALRRAISRCDAVINLAGEPLLGRFTTQRKQTLERSRVQTTEQIVHAIGELLIRPRVLISGSAVGYYGDRGDEVLTETSPPGEGFLAKLCVAWETAALGVESLGVRCVVLRTGIVLGRDGGALAKMLPIFRTVLGGPLGSGKQYLSWIHLHDHVEALVTALHDERYRGAINLTAPMPVTNEAFSRALGRALHRPVVVSVPAIVLKTLLGEAAGAILGGQRALPEQLRERGFRFRFATVEDALADILETKATSRLGLRSLRSLLRARGLYEGRASNRASP